MAKGETLGEFEHLVLLAIIRLGNDAYGMQVRRELSACTGRDVSIGAVYATLERLTAKAWIGSTLGEATPERGGRAKRSFYVTGAGIRASNRTRSELAAMLEGLSFPLPESFL